MYSIVRPLLFKLEPELAHNVALTSLSVLPSFCFKTPPPNPIKAMGLNFSHPVGLAAGLDKNGQYLDALAKIGFSSIELGTITPRPQAGNPKPRLFRLETESAIINRMGFNNDGVDALVNNVKKSSYKGILGINIGKNKDTVLNKAAEDYLICMRAVYEHASYITVNISSPNTPDLRQLQQTEYFDDLLSQLITEQMKLADRFQRHVPLVVKISPDETEETLKQMTETMLLHKVDGIIATNTTCARDLIQHVPQSNEQGGLSGQPLFDLSTQCLQLLKRYTGNAITLIGVGGINSVSNGQEKMDAGASLIQIYSGFIYQGPQLIHQLAGQLKRLK